MQELEAIAKEKAKAEEDAARMKMYIKQLLEDATPDQIRRLLIVAINICA